jgi:glyceraldehyde 3-phosphate dehydrogenase
MKNKKIKVGINGFGRIGRAFYKIAWHRDDIEVVAINDLGSFESMAYLLKYDSVYRSDRLDVTFDTDKTGHGGMLHVTDGMKKSDLTVFAEKEPKNIPWAQLGVDVVVESTGFFTEYDKAHGHIEAGAKKVVISAPAKMGENKDIKGEMVILGINEEKFGTVDITSNASCTTNGATPVIAILDQSIGIEKAMLSTTHAYTASQSLVDGPSKKDLREGRGAAQNIVPSSTGAAIAVTDVYPKLKGKFDGISLRVPVPSGSMVDVTFIASRSTTAEEVNMILKNAAENDHWKPVFQVTEESLVSTDILGASVPCIADLAMTRVVDGNLVKVLAWYDNEYGYTNTLVEHVIKTGNTIK